MLSKETSVEGEGEVQVTCVGVLQQTCEKQTYGEGKGTGTVYYTTILEGLKGDMIKQ